MNIIFYGTPEFAAYIADAIHQGSHKIVAVVTAPDRPKGRGKKVHKSDVKRWAEKNGLPVLQPLNLKDDGFLNSLKSYKPEVQVVVAFRMLPEAVWSLPQQGTFNLHASLLPQYRGAAPINWAIINREKETGVTTFFIDHKIDTGAVIAQRKTPITAVETAGSLHDKLMQLGAELTEETLNLIAQGKADPKPQLEQSNLKPAPKLTKKNTLVDWTKSAGEITAFIRGLYPYPVAKAELMDGHKKRIKIQQACTVDRQHTLPPGSMVVDGDDILVACGGPAADTNMVKLEKLQLPNKKPLTSKDLINGYDFDKEARFILP